MKLAIFVTFALLNLCVCEPLVGGWTEMNGASGSDFDLAAWATQNLASMTNFDGELTLIQVTNLKKQLVAGMRYIFTVDVLAAPKNGQHHTKSCTIEVYTRSWENFKEIVGLPTCVDKEINRSNQDIMTGGWSEENGASASEFDLANWAVKQTASLTNFAGELTLLAVKNVKKQLVAGMNYIFTVDVLAAPKEGKYHGKTCTIQVYTRPWENFQQVVGVPSCVDNKQILRSNDMMIGGWSEENGASASEFDLANWAVKQTASLTNFAGELTLLTVKNVKKQLVAGMNYIFTVDVLAAPKEGKYQGKTCSIQVYTRPWDNFKQVVGVPTCVDNSQILRVNQRLPGGWTEQNGASGAEFDLANWAVKQLASLTNFDGDLSLMQVKNVKKQVVAGMRYVFTVDVLSAPKKGQYGAQTCTFEIYTRPWENFQEIVGVPSCVENTTYFGKQPTF